MKEKWKNSRVVQKIRSVKNLEILIAGILAFFAVVAFFAIRVNDRKVKSVTTISTEINMTEEEARLASVLSKMDGIADANVYFSYDKNKEIIGVVVVAKGADDAEKRVSVIRCVEVATGVSVDKIQIFQMGNRWPYCIIESHLL